MCTYSSYLYNTNTLRDRRGIDGGEHHRLFIEGTRDYAKANEKVGDFVLVEAWEEPEKVFCPLRHVAENQFVTNGVHCGNRFVGIGEFFKFTAVATEKGRAAGVGHVLQLEKVLALRLSNVATFVESVRHAGYNVVDKQVYVLVGRKVVVDVSCGEETVVAGWLVHFDSYSQNVDGSKYRQYYAVGYVLETFRTDYFANLGICRNKYNRSEECHRKHKSCFLVSYERMDKQKRQEAPDVWILRIADEQENNC